METSRVVKSPYAIELANAILWYSFLYYQKGESPIEDAVFDALVAEAKEYEEKHQTVLRTASRIEVLHEVLDSVTERWCLIRYALFGPTRYNREILTPDWE